MFVDSHCHLDSGTLARMRDDVLERARAAGVGLFVAIGTDKNDSQEVIKIAENYEDVYATIGIHPHECGKEENILSVEEIIALANHPKVIGIGETGLDYFYNKATHAQQEENFRRHIRACIETGLPLVIHTRDAEEDTMRILADERKGNEDKLRGVFHCYSSNKELAAFGQEIDFYFSFSGILTFKKSQEVRETAALTPLDRLLVETDSPYLAPEPYRGKICEPAYVVKTAARLAEVRGLSPEKIEEITTDNFLNLFNKVEMK